ncbi:uncharacterized protein LOC114944404 [Nylanderia fulva]|uniref:uncharacterized protein LOC114944404 n=1 Tax=Nylanderia fulva TaxID=613905 RepID=UPI0010FB88DE|nr:uncharacterized protein LOC114944404 [Nylanderia fulva]XP_029176122.1 uncharacterized protein LOC114944404 [Nylanderia fulva]
MEKLEARGQERIFLPVRLPFLCHMKKKKSILIHPYLYISNKMNKNNQIRHKCGYCGWLFQFSTNFVEHECFKYYVEDKDRIVVDENFVVTICYNKNAKTAEGPTDTLDELLIEVVRARRGLYD